ncbi:MAG TPA: hypothetical protein VFX07_11860 [Candidatus Udaeobacter sp.]|nr:hypothetical protein [Candidatus Udaeobacter sp.]
MSNTITPTVFYRTPKVEALEIFYPEAGRPHITERTEVMYYMKNIKNERAPILTPIH